MHPSVVQISLDLTDLREALEMAHVTIEAGSAAKGARLTLTRNAVSYLNQYHIRVHPINPGWTLTPKQSTAGR
jgi:NAD(P)-dependent dehydrogenase (short-subunit alcohol dehydrogenase family)